MLSLYHWSVWEPMMCTVQTSGDSDPGSVHRSACEHSLHHPQMPLARPRSHSSPQAVSHIPGRAGPKFPALGGRHVCPNVFLIFLSVHRQALWEHGALEDSQRGCPLLTSHTQGWHYSNPRSLESAQQWRLHSPPPQAGPWSSPASPDPSYKVSVKEGERFLLPC